MQKLSNSSKQHCSSAASSALNAIMLLASCKRSKQQQIAYKHASACAAQAQLAARSSSKRAAINAASSAQLAYIAASKLASSAQASSAQKQLASALRCCMQAHAQRSSKQRAALISSSIAAV